MAAVLEMAAAQLRSRHGLRYCPGSRQLASVQHPLKPSSDVEVVCVFEEVSTYPPPRAGFGPVQEVAAEVLEQAPLETEPDQSRMFLVSVLAKLGVGVVELVDPRAIQ